MFGSYIYTGETQQRLNGKFYSYNKMNGGHFLDHNAGDGASRLPTPSHATLVVGPCVKYVSVGSTRSRTDDGPLFVYNRINH